MYQVMGMGFYGRSFTLADPSCIGPPCPWVSGGDGEPYGPNLDPDFSKKKNAAGPCSANSGTLMFSEIETILETSSAQIVFDEVAAVKYVVWDS
jgi:hypothetical protein